MEQFKIDNYERRHGKGSFPTCGRLGARASKEVRKQLAAALGLRGSPSGIAICQAAQSRSEQVKDVDAESEDFDLDDVLKALRLPLSGSVYLNWYQYDDLDVMSISDVTAYFTDIWYPSSDDLDLVDQDLSWILSISHYGAVRLTRLKESEGADELA